MLLALNTHRRQSNEFFDKTGVSVSALHLLRHFRGWTLKKKLPCNSMDDRIPWMTFEAIRFLDRFIDTQSNVFEWGMGGSTLFFLDRAGQIVSVDHDATWFDRLHELISSNDAWKGYRIEPTCLSQDQAVDPSSIDQYGSSSPEYQSHRFEDYVRVIDQYDDQSFDIIVDDGRSRPSCVKHGIPKLKLGGILVLDNAERPQYKQIHQMLCDKSKWQKIDCSGPAPYAKYFWSTVIWKKNKGLSRQAFN